MISFEKGLLLTTATILMLAVSVGSVHPQGSARLVEVGSGLPQVTATDRALAQAVDLRRSGRRAEERALLLDHLDRAPRGNRETDAVVLRLADYFPRNRALQSEVLNRVDREQLKRLMQQCQAENQFALEALFAEEYLQRYPTRQEARNIRHALAMAYMMSDVDEKQAVGQWQELVSRYPNSEQARVAEVYLEAIRGPESIPAFEAAYKIGEMQSRRARNPYRSIFSNDRVIGSADRPFLAEYLSSPGIPDSQKVEILNKLMFSYHQLGQHNDSRDVALKVLELSGYRGPYAENAAMTVCLSHWMSADYPRAIDNFEWFLRVFPSSREAPRANYYKARVHLEVGQYKTAFIEFEVLQKMYPGTEHARQAHRYAGALRLHYGDWLEQQSVDQDLARLLEGRLINNNDPSEWWTVADGSAIEALFNAEVADAGEVEADLLRLSQLFPGE